MPCAEMLQTLKYPIMEVDNENGIYQLHQYELLNSDREISVEDAPKWRSLLFNKNYNY